MEVSVKMNGITMRFGPVVANDGVDFEVYKGEVHALVGENGAGKTTLMNILYGLYMPTEGSVEVNGAPVQFRSAIDAIRAGIGMVHQHFMLIPRLSVADNIALGDEPRRGARYDRARAVQAVEELCRQYEMNIDPKAQVAKISLGMQQRVEIMKALYRKADILILDEPTAVLTPQEIDELGEMLQKLKAMGKTIIIITHKLKEVLSFSDRVTVLRRGRIVGTVVTGRTTAEDITQMMVGRSVHLGGDKQPSGCSGEMLQVQHVNYSDGRTQKLRDVSLTVRRGEILGIAGIDNSGQKELTEVIAGVLAPQSGKVLLGGEDVTGRSVTALKKLGVGFIPQDRQKDGLVMNATIRENLMLGYQRWPEYCKAGWLLDKAGIKADAQAKIGAFDVRPDNMELLAANLSGGNQQKVVVAREVSHAGQLIIADQPSRGVDIGATELIHQHLVQARNQGQAVLLVSLELDEVMLLSDRIAVLHDGEIMGVVDGKTATREQLGLMMAGQRGGGEA